MRLCVIGDGQNSQPSYARSSIVARSTYTTLVVTGSNLTHVYLLHTCPTADPLVRRVSKTGRVRKDTSVSASYALAVSISTCPAEGNSHTTNGFEKDVCLRNRSWGVRGGQTRAVDNACGCPLGPADTEAVGTL